MGLLRYVITAAITALGLAAWNLYINPIYHAWIEQQGKHVGLAEEALGYFVVLLIVWAFAAIVVKRMER